MKAGFYPTEHFLFRCWERGISEDILIRVLRRVKILKGRYVVLATEKELNKLGCNPLPPLVEVPFASSLTTADSKPPAGFAKQTRELKPTTLSYK